MIDLDSFASAVQHSSFGVWAAQSTFAYPIANVAHVLGLVMLVGGIGFLDLRLSGLFRSIPLGSLSRAVTPIAIGGLLVMIPSGATMFAADAEALVHSSTFQLKLALILVALLNAAAFRLLWGRRIALWANGPPAAARIMAVASIGLWLGVATLGRWIAYS